MTPKSFNSCLLRCGLAFLFLTITTLLASSSTLAQEINKFPKEIDAVSSRADRKVQEQHHAKDAKKSRRSAEVISQDGSQLSELTPVNEVTRFRGEVETQTPAANRKRCIPDEESAEAKYFYFGDQAIPLKIYSTNRLTHQLTSTILQIFAEEILGYANISVHYAKNVTATFDLDYLYSQLSNCNDSLCDNLNQRSTVDNDTNSSRESFQQFGDRVPPPDSMINMEVWLPPNQPVVGWKLADLGTLGPGGRFGWFIPKRFAESSPPIKDHWRAFLDPKIAQLFSLDPEDYKVIHKLMKQKNGRFVCQENYCENGMFVPDQCKKFRHEDTRTKSKDCSIMLVGHPVHSAFYSTEYAVQQIKELKLFVSLAFVGNNLDKAVHHMSTVSKPVLRGDKSYLVLHFTPSRLANLYEWTNIKFEPCREDFRDPVYGQLFTAGNSDCLYTKNRFAKVIWSPLVEGVQDLYITMKNMELSLDDYNDLLTLYNSNINNSIEEQNESNQLDLVRKVACEWLSSPIMPNGKTKNFERWNRFLKTKQKLRIGGIFPMNGNKFRAPELLPVALMAQNDINRNNSILPNYQLELFASDGECRADVVMKNYIKIITNKDFRKYIVGILGPACSDTIEPVAGVSKHFKTVVITYSAEGSITGENAETQYPYFFRTIAENKQYKYVYLKIFEKFGWDRVASLTQDGHKYSEYISILQDHLQTHGIEFLMNRKFPKESPDMSMYLKDLRDRGSKIIIGEFFEQAARIIMCEAYKLGMTQKQGFVWFLPGWFHYDWYDVDSIRNDERQNQQFTPNCTTAQMKEAIEGHLSLIHAIYAKDTEMMQTGHTVGQWRKRMEEKVKEKERFHSANKYSGNVYDAVWLYALSLDRLVKQNKSYIQDFNTNRSIQKFVKIIKETDFQGVTGRINFVSGHSRLSNIKILQWYNNEGHEIGVFEPNYELGATNASLEDGGRLIEWNKHVLRWQTHDGSIPDDHALECSILSNFANTLEVECEHAIILAFVIGFALLLCLLLLVFLVVKRRYERKMRHTEERMRALGLLTPTSLLTLDEWEIPRDRVVINRKLGEGAFGTVYGGEAFFDEKGWVAVAVKTLKTGSTVQEKIDFLSEADMMKRFDHKNIVKLLGVCTRNEPVYTVMEFMLYGDLKTYLLARRHLVNERNREELDEVSNRRLTSMALHVARGLTYLAELKYVHRDVACRNCLVNSSRVVKLADFGMTRPMYENDYYRFNKKGMLPVRWMAPESLADGLFTPMSDIWSFGVLLFEMITFGSFPFQGLSNNQVLEHVKAGNTLAIPAGIKSQLETVLKSCWHKVPTKRPTASEMTELLSNNSRLISPCIDVPLASVQVERTDSLELIPNMRKMSESVSAKPVHLVYRRSVGPRDNSASSSKGGDSGAYSPMGGIPNGSPFIMSNYSDPREPLLVNGSDLSTDRLMNGNNVNVSSYVPPGYIVLDHRGETTTLEMTPEQADPKAVSSV